jgi:hypothetical protein
MTKTFNIPFLFILIFLASKEIFSYDSEKVVILCILCFAITAYYNMRTVIYESFLATSSKIEEEMNHLLELKLKLEKSIKHFWTLYLRLEDLLIEIYFWVKVNFKNFIKKANKNRILFNFHIIKDQLNFVVKDTLVTKYLFESVYKTMIINNFYFMLDSNINSNAKNLDISTFFSKLKTSSEKNTFVELTLNKLNLDKAIVVDNNVYNLNTLLLLNVKLK